MSVFVRLLAKALAIRVRASLAYGASNSAKPRHAYAGNLGGLYRFLNQITFSFEMSTYTFDSLIVVTLGDKDAG